jgi:hypothetical protein
MAGELVEGVKGEAAGPPLGLAYMVGGDPSGDGEQPRLCGGSGIEAAQRRHGPEVRLLGEVLDGAGVCERCQKSLKVLLGEPYERRRCSRVACLGSHGEPCDLVGVLSHGA